MSTTTESPVTALPLSSKTPASHPFQASPVKRKTMSITQTYFLAHKARAKLSSQAARPDHNLRLLVGHANLLDTLMLELADAEREQESWFNQSVRVASPAGQQSPAAAAQKTDRHVQWADAIVEEEEEEESEGDWEADDSDVSSDTSSEYTEEDEGEEEEQDSESSLENEDYVYDEDCDMADSTPLRRVASHTSTSIISTSSALTTSSSSSSSSLSSPSTTTISIEVTEAEDDSDAEVDDEEEDYTQLTLTRSPSHSVSASLPSPTSPPELVMEDSDVSEDEAMPPSPPALTLESFPKSTVATKQQQQQQQPATKYDDSDRLYLPPRNSARLVSSVSVY